MNKALIPEILKVLTEQGPLPSEEIADRIHAGDTETFRTLYHMWAGYGLLSRVDGHYMIRDAYEETGELI